MKKKLSNSGICCPGRSQSKIKERKKKDKYLDLAWELKKKHVTSRWRWDQLLLVHSEQPQRIGKGTGRLGNKKTSEYYPDDNIIKIGQNTEKSPGDLRRLAVTQTPVESHQLTLVWIILKGIITIKMIIILWNHWYSLGVYIKYNLEQKWEHANF